MIATQRQSLVTARDNISAHFLANLAAYTKGGKLMDRIM
jgi:hypothetical protein